MRLSSGRCDAPNPMTGSDRTRPGPLTEALIARREHPVRDATLRRWLLWFVALWFVALWGVLCLAVVALLMHGGMWVA